MKPLAIDLYCGLGGWTEGLLAEGYEVIGFDIEAHDYGDGRRYPAQLVIQDVLTIHGKRFKDAALIVASPPCQEFSYMAMPWSRAKAIAVEYRNGKRDVKKLTALFDACLRIQREAIAAAGHFIPMVVENVRGAQPWVGRARWNFGSYYLWGDVPALMPITMPRRKSKVGSWDVTRQNFTREKGWQDGIKAGDRNTGDGWNSSFADSLKSESYKSSGMNWSDRSKHGQDFTRIAGAWRGKHYEQTAKAALAEGIKGFTPNGGPLGKNQFARKHGSKSSARKAASAAIAKIPFALAQWIARVWKTRELCK